MIQFVHIPRTGGTALLGVFKKWYNDLEVSYIEHEIKKTKMIYGHILIEGCDYILFLRNPVMQQISYYNYTKRFVPMMPIDDYFRTQPSTMIKFLPDFKRVIFVGIYEYFDEDVKRLADFLDKPYIKPNIKNKGRYKEYPSLDALKEFVENNKSIIKLYYEMLSDRRSGIHRV